MNEYLKLSNGTIFPNSKAYEDGTGLEVIIADDDIRKVRDAFSVKDNAKQIIYHYYKVDLVFDGYTNLISTMRDGNRINVRLVKEVTKDGGD